jgi:hypothetical protein
MEDLREMVLAQLKGLKPSILSKKPHFNFISIHCKLAVRFSGLLVSITGAVGLLGHQISG